MYTKKSVSAKCILQAGYKMGQTSWNANLKQLSKPGDHKFYLFCFFGLSTVRAPPIQPHEHVKCPLQKSSNKKRHKSACLKNVFYVVFRKFMKYKKDSNNL